LHCFTLLSPKAKLDQCNQSRLAEIYAALPHIPKQISNILSQEEELERIASLIESCQQVIYLGRHNQYPIALEGALKLKEISYINANAYAAGELKHGPLALVDTNTIIVYLVPNNHILEKNLSNMAEIQARGGKIICIAEQGVENHISEALACFKTPKTHSDLSPIVQNIPLQLIAYFVAHQKGNDVDQPRNLAKSVTVE